MEIWENMQNAWQKLFSSKNKTVAGRQEKELEELKNIDSELPIKATIEEKLDKALEKTQLDIDRLLKDPKLPEKSKQVLAEDYKQLSRIIEKIEKKQFHISVFGRVSVGKSSLLNALIGNYEFSTSVLHGETKDTADIFWQKIDNHGIVFIDTPGIDELSGERRTEVAKQTVSMSDMVLFVIDGDLTQTEYDALVEVNLQLKPIIVVINKVERLNEKEKKEIEQSVKDKLETISKQIKVVLVSADPRKKEIIKVDSEGNETTVEITPKTNIEQLKTLIWDDIKESGHILQAVSTTIFTSQVTDRIGAEIVSVRSEVASDIIRKYCIGKTFAVGLNPIPLLDLAIVFGDIAMIKHLASIYGFDINKKESSLLLKSIITEMTLVLGVSFGISALSSVLKGLSLGLSTVLTASTQGMATYYGTYLVGRASEDYFKKGASWGEDGIDAAIKAILVDIDKEEIMQEAKDDIKRVLGKL